jgi:putative hydrolase of the HAD superfamily
MLHWIFDLDYTLYQLPRGTSFSYNELNKDSQLKYLLKKLPCSKLMFTNGTIFHADTCIKKMELSNCFQNVIARDSIQDLKPNPSAFQKFEIFNKIDREDKCVFFEDSVDNLVVAKDRGWITVLICPNQNQHQHENIDFYFPNIYVALNYFNQKIDSHFDTLSSR